MGILILQCVGLLLLIGLLQIFSIKSVNRIDDIKYYLLSCFILLGVFFLLDNMPIDTRNTSYLLFLILFMILITTLQSKKEGK